MESCSGKLRVFKEPYTTPQKLIQAFSSLETVTAPLTTFANPKEPWANLNLEEPWQTFFVTLANVSELQRTSANLSETC